MIALILCAVAFAAAYLGGRKSLVAGLGAVLAAGYMYGIVRANVLGPLSYFTFDAAVAGLYLALLSRPVDPWTKERSIHLRHWVILLSAWPLVLLLMPIQDPLVQLVGFRAHVYFLPFLLLGARLDSAQLQRLTRIVALLTLVSFGFAIAEFFLGVPAFYPRSSVTELIYRSNDVRVEGSLVGLFRIPATFANAAQYGATMVLAVPVLLGGLFRSQGVRSRALLAAALGAAVIGVFLSASRTNMLLLGVVLFASMVSGKIGVAGRMAWAGMIAALGWVLSTDDRLFVRLLSISPDAVIERIGWSTNWGVIESVARYPMGNGLGGGGNSIPGFLMGLVRNPPHVENQYATIMLEQGFPGLLLWFGFLAWLLTRSGVPRSDPLFLTRRLMWVTSATFLATGFLGAGLFTSVPGTPLLLLWMGWISVPHPAEAPEPSAAPAPPPLWAALPTRSHG